MSIRKYGGRYWAVYDGTTLVCVCLYKKGATEVLRRLQQGPVPTGSAVDTRSTARTRSL
jgi:hypothetical protein